MLRGHGTDYFLECQGKAEAVEERDGMLNSGMERGMNQSYDALDRLLSNMR
jgi:hypothetical protein